MIKIINILVSVSVVFGAVSGLDRPSYIQPCSVTDPDLNECVIKHANIAIEELVKGDKTFKIPSLIPLRIDKVIIEPGNNLKFILTKFAIYGLKHAQVFDADARIDEESSITLKLRVPKIEVIGNYDVSGRILILPVVGNGRCNITLEDVIVSHELKFRVNEVKGDRYAYVTNNTVQYEPNHVYFYFENLFNGDPRLGPEMLIFLNENWREVNAEISLGITGTMESVIEIILKNLFKVPYDNLVLP